MELSYRGEGNRRKPLDFKDNGDGTYTILDGNSTYANAVDSEWKELPGVVVEEAKPRKKASIDVGRMSRDLLYADADKLVKKVLKKGQGLDSLSEIYATSLPNFSTTIKDIIRRPAIKNRSVGGFAIAMDILDDSGKTVGQMKREFRRGLYGSLHVEHSYFWLNPKARNQGFAAEINEHVEAEYEKLGVSDITLEANEDIGGYAWARQGYDFTSFAQPDIRTKFQKFVTAMNSNGKISDEELESFMKDIDSFEHSWDYANWNPTNKPHGKHLGKSIMLGLHWDAKKTLDKKSPGYQIGKAYFAAKRNVKIKS